MTRTGQRRLFDYCCWQGQSPRTRDQCRSDEEEVLARPSGLSTWTLGLNQRKNRTREELVTDIMHVSNGNDARRRHVKKRINRSIHQ